MLIHKRGNLLESHKDGISIIAHQSNCVMGFGSGIALQIRNQLPGAAKAFYTDGRTSEEKLGRYTSATENIGPFLMVFNLYGQLLCGGEPGVVYTDYKGLEDALTRMFLYIEQEYGDQNLKIGVPYKIGCGLAGGDWNIVESILNKVSDNSGRDIFVYEYTP